MIVPPRVTTAPIGTSCAAAAARASSSARAIAAGKGKTDGIALPYRRRARYGKRAGRIKHGAT
ncbi:hypothetical protein GCM10007897_20970 [Sphingobium jiangsuense]|nr:hypothetical protein GCM10007897_20970 [Sphingobium jiangsuense]